jgi:flagellar motility protein MotE (MotC chaperone)
MKGRMREIRIIPIVLIAVGSLFALKATGLWLDGGYTLGQRLSRGGETITVTTMPASPSTPLQSQSSPLDVASLPDGERRRSWAQQMFGYPEITGSVAGGPPKETVIVTGSVGAAKEPPKEPAKDAKAADKPKDAKDNKDAKDTKDAKAKPDAPQTKPAAPERPADVASRPEMRTVSTSERQVLERLLERRQELETKAREIELRETLLKQAEKNLETKLAALKEKENSGNGKQRSEMDEARFKNLVTMYETMKPKDAAKIFDRLDIKVLAEVAAKINARRMSEILAVMSAEAAERLTLEFASRGDADKKPADLPKIDGKPTGG